MRSALARETIETNADFIHRITAEGVRLVQREELPQDVQLAAKVGNGSPSATWLVEPKMVQRVITMQPATSR